MESARRVITILLCPAMVPHMPQSKTHAKYRVLICLLSVGLGCGVFLLLGLQRHAEKLFGSWYSGLAWIFLSLFTALTVLILRDRFIRVRWLFPICIVLSYVAGIVANVVYFAIWEPVRLTNALTQNPIYVFLMVQLFIPTAALVWLFGAFVCVFFLSLERLARKFL